MIATPGVSVRRTLGVPLRGFVMTPMDTGLRICGTVEFAGLDSPPNFERARNLVRHAKAILPDLNPHIDSVWMGHRPSFPDGLPVIDRAPRHSNVIYAFGHGHMGLSWAATTGGLVVDILAGRASSMDISPFRATRFASSW